MKQLGEMIAEFPSLLDSSKFIFVPGPQDPGPSPVLPRWGQPLLLIIISAIELAAT